MDVIASVPSFDKIIAKTVHSTGLIDVGVTHVTHEAWKDSKATVAAETDVLHAVRQDPAVLEAQLARESTRPPGAASSTAGDRAALAGPHNGATAGSHFERLAGEQWRALRALPPRQLALLLRYVGTLRRQRHALQRTLECAFCKNNGESLAWYTQHALKDWRGRVLCPVLRAFRCPRCGATGDRAHTIKYCPENNEADRWSF